MTDQNAWEAAIRPVVEQAMQGSQIPGVVIAAARGGEATHYLAVGVDAGGQAVDRQTLVPVASVTKLATALAVLRLVDEGRIDFDDELALLLPEAAAAQTGVTIRRLLCHTSGLPDDLPEDAAPYGPQLSWPALADACLHTSLQTLPDERVEYSNVGYGLLALAVERVLGRPFGEALREVVLDPLGVEAYLGDEPRRDLARLTGQRGSQVGTDLEAYNGRFWRSLALPWSGLVTNVDGALALVQAYRGRPDGFLHDQTLAEATRNQVGALSCNLFGMIPWPHCHWGLGPELRDDKSPHWAPPEASAESFGHAGQSGCIVWADPATNVAWAIIGTRTADSGWLLRRGPEIGTAILQATRR